jgi:hypothetical protein
MAATLRTTSNSPYMQDYAGVIDVSGTQTEAGTQIIGNHWLYIVKHEYPPNK